MNALANRGGRNGSVDVLRMWMAVFVMVNHSCVFGSLTHDVLEMAVPVFLMLSGYFFYTPDASTERQRCERQLRKIGKLLAFSYAFYILWHLLWSIWHSKPLMFEVSTLYTCNNSFAPHIWYLHAYLLMLAVVSAVHRLGWRLGRIRCRYLLLYAAACCCTFYTDGIPSLVMKVFGFCLGFFFVGMAMRRLTVKMPRCLTLLLLLGVSLCGCFASPLMGMDSENYSLFTVLASALAVEAALSVYVDSSRIMARMGQDLSLHVYIFHWAVLDVINTEIYTDECSHVMLYSKPIVLVGLSILVAYAFLRTPLARLLVK